MSTSTSSLGDSSSWWPVIPLFAAGLITVTRLRKQYSLKVVVAVDLVVALAIAWILPQTSIVPWWGPLTLIVCQWPFLFGKVVPSMFVHGGPLGNGCSKLVEVLVAISLWKIVYQEWPRISLGPLPSLQSWIFIGIFSLLVNVVLQYWSVLTKSRGDHSGVNEMVQETQGRSLLLKEHLKLLGLGFFYVFCEEITSRWFWRHEFANYLPQPHYSNLAQAVVFGIWHYHGIPSGITGVLLTLVYGFLMGLLYDYGNGLWLPVVAHGIADYYIFAMIVRQQNLEKPKD